MNTSINSIVSKNIDRVISIAEIILKKNTPRYMLYSIFVPSLLRMKHNGLFCEKVYEIMVDTIFGPSSESSSPSLVIETLSRELITHYNRVIGEVCSDISLIKSNADLLREKRIIGYKVKFGEIEYNIAKVLMACLPKIPNNLQMSSRI